MPLIMNWRMEESFDWKGNFYIKCKRVKDGGKTLLVLFLIAVGCFECVQCSDSAIKSDSRLKSGRTAFEHGLFRHDKPLDSIQPSLSSNDLSSPTKNVLHHTTCQSAHGCQTSDSNVPPSSPARENRDRYTYERFKRSVTTLNFHPKPKNESKIVGVKPLRIFKYITEDDVLLKPASSERQHVTIFQPIVNAVNNKRKHSNTNEKNVKGETTSIAFDNDTSRQQVIGGTKVNLKSKLDKRNDHQNNTSNNQVINSIEAKSDKIKNNVLGTQSKAPQNHISPSPKPENILIFKPSLVIRKSNKTSLIPSGNHPSKYNNFNHGSGANNIVPSITAATTAAVAAKTQKDDDDESADPNSSTVNDRSLIHNNVYFDSVVMLNEEGQKQLLHQQHQTVQAHYEKSRKSNGEKDDNDEIKNSKSEVTPSSSFSSKSNVNSYSGTNVVNDNVKSKKNQKKISPSLSAAKNSKSNAKDKLDAQNQQSEGTSNSPNNGNKKASDLVQKLTHTIDGKITGNSRNKEKAIVKVIKSKKGKNSKKTKSPQIGLDQDDIEQDGSERSRRSPFKVPIRFQQTSNNNNNPRYKQVTQTSNNGGNQQLTRAALFRRNPSVTRIRSAPMIGKKVIPRVLSPVPVSHLTSSGKLLLARTILPMKPMPMMSVKQGRPNLALVPGPVGPGPVGPPIAAIKVPNFNNRNTGNANKNILVPPPLLTGKDLMADASRTVYSYKPISDQDLLLNHAASSYYSPTYKKFKKRFQHQIANMMESQRDLEDTINHWEESRPYRPSSHSKPRPRNSGRHHRDRDHSRYHQERERHDRNDRNDRGRDRYTHSHHRSGQHSHHPHHRPSRGKKLNPKYAYPKNAENIQDILKFFDKEAPGGPMSSFDKEGSTNPNRQQSVLPGGGDSSAPPHPKLADLSGEFRDVHASLLKDIREFAKRPNLFGGSSDKSERSQGHPLDSRENGSPFDPIDEIFGPKAKPVRDLIKPDLYSLENIRERIAFKRGKLHGRYRDKDRDVSSHRDEHHQHDEHQHDEHRPHSDVGEDEGFYDSHRPSRHNSEGGHSGENVKNLLFSKEEYDSPSTYIKRDKQKDTEDSHTIFPSSHFLREKDSIKENSNPFEFHSAEITKAPSRESRPSPTKPVVIKRPNEPYRVREAEPKKKPEHDYFWNTFSNGFEKSPTVNYEAPMVIKSPAPSVLQPYNPYHAFGPSSASAATHSIQKPISVEEEDIVEIHTGGGPGHSVSGVQSFPSQPSQNHFKQENLKKMYMDVLQQKMQLEAALMQPQVPAMQSPTMHHHHHHPMMTSMHTSASLLPQHNHMHPQHNHMHPQQNPLQITRIGHAPQMSAYSPTPTLSPLSGMTSITRRKKPMRMKIHIYPNGNDGLEQGIEAANLLAAGGFGTSGFSASNPPGVVAPPPKDAGLGKQLESAMPSGPPGPLPTSPSGFGGPSLSGPMGPIPTKNKNVVLHLHVHRRNDALGPLELETEGSAPVPVTAKPLTYKEIFDEQMKMSEQQRNTHLSNHRQAEEEEESSHSIQDTQEGGPIEDSERGERDKSISMEVPIHDEKIEDVFHSIMKLRKKPDDRKKRS